MIEKTTASLRFAGPEKAKRDTLPAPASPRQPDLPDPDPDLTARDPLHQARVQGKALGNGSVSALFLQDI